MVRFLGKPLVNRTNPPRRDACRRFVRPRQQRNPLGKQQEQPTETASPGRTFAARRRPPAPRAEPHPASARFPGGTGDGGDAFASPVSLLLPLIPLVSLGSPQCAGVLPRYRPLSLLVTTTTATSTPGAGRGVPFNNPGTEPGASDEEEGAEEEGGWLLELFG